MPLLRLLLVGSIGIIFSSAAVAKEDGTPPAKAAEYHRPDSHLYYQPTIVKANPGAVIVPKSDVVQKDDVYTFAAHKKAPKDLYVETSNDWIEPITPPGATSALAIEPNEMVVREPQGDVRVALPSAPTNFIPVNDGMTLANGSVLKTGDGATAAVLIGGVFSARLMPNSEAAVQQTVVAATHTAEVDLTSGGVFSKVGQQVGVKSNYEVHTPSGVASAQGGDFVTLALQGHTDVWVESGTVSFLATDDKTPQSVTADGSGPLQALRIPPPTQVSTAVNADADALTAMFNFIPVANQKVKVLRDRAANGTVLSDAEQAYLKRIKQVPALMKLALVPPPTPVKPVVPKPAPLATAPMPLRDAAAPAAPAPVAPVTPPAPTAPTEAAATSPSNAIGVFPSGKVRFRGEVLTLDKFKVKMFDAVKAAPQEVWKIHYFPNVPKDKAMAAADTAKAAGADRVMVSLWKMGQTSDDGATTPTPAPSPAPEARREPAAEGSPATPAAPAAVPATPVAATPVKPASLIIHAYSSGKVKFHGKVMTLDEFTTRLKEDVAAKPDSNYTIQADSKVPQDKVQAVVDACKTAGAQNVTAPTPAATPEKPPVPATLAAVPAATPAPTAAEGVTPGKDAAPMKPETVAVHANGSIRFMGQTIGLKEFDAKLKKLVAEKPDQELIIKSGAKIPYDKLKAVLDSCADAQVKHITITNPAPAPPSAAPAAPETSSTPTPAPVPESPANNLPAPSLRMSPALSVEPPPSSNAPSTNAPAATP